MKQKTMKKPDCPFCSPDVEQDILLENGPAYAIYDRFPVNTGHILVIPRVHQGNFFELPERTRDACMSLLGDAMKMVSELHHPDGFNVGINIDEAAGQTIDHVHIHLIPRYKGDVEFPRGGVRGVIPDKRDY
jgi:ATP adenylyltransferase